MIVVRVADENGVELLHADLFTLELTGRSGPQILILNREPPKEPKDGMRQPGRRVGPTWPYSTHDGVGWLVCSYPARMSEANGYSTTGLHSAIGGCRDHHGEPTLIVEPVTGMYESLLALNYHILYASIYYI